MASLTVERSLPVPPQVVWRAFADPARIDATPGGGVRIRSDVADLGVTGRVTEAEEPRVLAFTWRWDGEDEETQAALRLQPDGDGTRLTVHHDGFADEEAVSHHIDGWNDCLDRLAAALT